MQTDNGIRLNKVFFTGRRNLVMVARYYYYTEIVRRRFDDTLYFLSTEEFFIAERTITDYLNQYSSFFNELKKNNVDGNELRRMFPSWDWSQKSQKPEKTHFIESYQQ